MGMFDSFIPDPPLRCPLCNSLLDGWQGKDGENALFVWKQGEIAPIDQEVPEECRLLPEDMSQVRLSEDFEIYTTCDEHWIDAIGYLERGVWSRTEITGAKDREVSTS